MEIKRKKITNEAIYEAEQKLIGEIRTLCDSKKAQFEELGYDLELVFGQKENEAEIRYKEFDADENKSFYAGYISHAVVSIKRKKTAEELADDEAAMAANRALLDAAETDEEVDQIQNDEELRGRRCQQASHRIHRDHACPHVQILLGRMGMSRRRHA